MTGAVGAEYSVGDVSPVITEEELLHTFCRANWGRENSKRTRNEIEIDLKRKARPNRDRKGYKV